VSDARLSLLLNGRRITPDMALRIGRFLDTPADYWLQLQMDYDLFQARERYARELEEAKPPVA
jgi:addiction module HigA family antidote